jgi:hypothetical protein
MRRLEKCLHLYIGCETNLGQFVGFKKDCLLIQAVNEQTITEHPMQGLGSSVFLYLKKLDDLTEEESRDLIKKGIAIGRPNGYTFSNEGFLYLLSLNVDLFGLINSGYARQQQDT